MRTTYLWDYDIDDCQFADLLEGKIRYGRLDQEWAYRRLFEYGPYPEILRLVSFRQIVEWWPKIRTKIRSRSRVRGFDFLVDWLPRKHPDWIHG